MKTAIILHGSCDEEEYFSDAYPSLSNSHWLPWLQKQLLVAKWEAHTPEITNAFWPDYERWCKELERYEINKNTVLVGHSCGGGFLVRWLSEHPLITPRRVILVAPWLDPDQKRNPAFFDFTPDLALTERVDIHILISDDDENDILRSVKTIQKAYPDATTHPFTGHGHFCRGTMGTEEFPFLRDLVLSAYA